MDRLNSEASLEQLRSALNDIDRELVDIDGKKLKPSQCYRLETDPAHVLFNTNCPDSLKERIQALMTKYLPHDENSTS
ncbi:MAG: hypothetical protein EOO01_04710 [Chitinophagaceae bacterium]|nr:MAG: hypothetical protein EOO01_04710 [Chitinophagaceae bacterium]